MGLELASEAYASLLAGHDIWFMWGERVPDDHFERCAPGEAIGATTAASMHLCSPFPLEPDRPASLSGGVCHARPVTA